MNPDDNFTIQITVDEAHERIDKVLANRYTGQYSRSYFQQLLEEGLIIADGKPLKKRDKLCAGSEIEVGFTCTQQIDVAPENIPLSIIYEDNDILLINKPAGMVVHPAAGNWHGTFVNALLYYCKQWQKDLNVGEVRPGIVHRLDKDTSGLLLAAKNRITQQRLIELFSQRKIKKEYLALCIGNPGSGTLSAPIGRHPTERKMMAIQEEGRQASTRYITLAKTGQLSIVRAFPETGRTHQIRVHLRHLNAPILGDDLYGSSAANRKYKAHRQMLHAEKLQFRHPTSGEEVEFSAPLPEDFLQLCTSNNLNF